MVALVPTVRLRRGHDLLRMPDGACSYYASLYPSRACAMRFTGLRSYGPRRQGKLFRMLLGSVVSYAWASRAEEAGVVSSSAANEVGALRLVRHAHHPRKIGSMGRSAQRHKGGEPRGSGDSCGAECAVGPIPYKQWRTCDFVCHVGVTRTNASARL